MNNELNKFEKINKVIYDFTNFLLISGAYA